MINITQSKFARNLTIIVGLGATGWSVLRFLLWQQESGAEYLVLDSRDQPPYLAQLQQLQQQYPQIHSVVGAGALNIINTPGLAQRLIQVVLSPGVARQRRAWKRMMGDGGRVLSDLDLFTQYLQAHHLTPTIIAITGSNGKSTVTTLVGQLLQQLGYQVAVGGNLGVPVLEFLTGNDPNTKQRRTNCSPYDYYVLELSNFQLELTQQLVPNVAVLLNISPDHLDSYATFDQYIEAKLRVFNRCQSAVVNSDELVPGGDGYQGYGRTQLRLPQLCTSFGRQGDFTVRDGQIYYNDNDCCSYNDDNKVICRSTELKLHGEHNLYNVAASLAVLNNLSALRLLPILNSAVTANYTTTSAIEQVLPRLRNFSGLPHRMEWVAEFNQVQWFNDSKGTNVGATLAALQGLAATLHPQGGKIVLILGGVGKGAQFSALREPVLNHVRALIFIGRDASQIQQDLQIPYERLPQLVVANLEQVVQQAKQLAQPHDAVLFSPACASFDMFANYQQRGERFKQLVHNIHNII